MTSREPTYEWLVEIAYQGWYYPYLLSALGDKIRFWECCWSGVRSGPTTAEPEPEWGWSWKGGWQHALCARLLHSLVPVAAGQSPGCSTVSLHRPNGRPCLPLGLCKETVKRSMSVLCKRGLWNSLCVCLPGLQGDKQALRGHQLHQCGTTYMGGQGCGAAAVPLDRHPLTHWTLDPKLSQYIIINYCHILTKRWRFKPTIS